MIKVNLKKEKPEFPWSDVIGWGLTLLVLSGIGTCSYNELQVNQLRQANCQAAHHGQFYTEESPYAVTQSGCHVIEVDKYNGSCYHVKTLYVTDCKGVNWSESHGKSGSTDESTSNP